MDKKGVLALTMVFAAVIMRKEFGVYLCSMNNIDSGFNDMKMWVWLFVAGQIPAPEANLPGESGREPQIMKRDK